MLNDLTFGAHFLGSSAHFLGSFSAFSRKFWRIFSEVELEMPFGHHMLTTSINKALKIKI